MSHGEIKALYKLSSLYKVLKLNNKPCSCSETPKSINNIDMVDVQRLSDDVGVKP